MNRIEVAQRVKASVTTVNRYARKHGIEKYTADDILALERELENNRRGSKRKVLLNLIKEAGEAGIGESEIAMKLDIYVCEARRRVMWLIEHGYPIFDQKIKRGKTQVKYRFYFDGTEEIEE